MKKIVLSIIVALIAITANAQVYVGGTFGVGSDKVETEGTEVKNTTFKILPEVGYELNEDWSVGTVVGYEYNKSGDVYDDPTDTAGKEPFPLPALQEKRCALGNAGGHLLRQDNAFPMQCRYTHEAVLRTGYPDGAAHYADRGETTNAWRQAD